MGGSCNTRSVELSAQTLSGISVTLVLLGLGFVVFYQPEERTEWFRRKALGFWLIAGGAVSLVLTLIVTFG
jgi:hypothetical protein